MNMSSASSPKFYCSPCSEKFISQYEFDQHIRLHLQKKYFSVHMEYIEPYMCKMCYKTFEEKGELILHNKMHCYNSVLICDICGRNFMNKMQLNKHTLSCNKTYKVTVISSEIVKENEMGNKWSLPKGLPFNPSRNLFTSETAFTRLVVPEQDLNRPINIKSSKSVVCSSNKRRFRTEQKLLEINNYNLEDEKYTCEVCSETFRRKCVLDTHRRKHMDGGFATYRFSEVLNSNTLENVFTSKRYTYPVNSNFSCGDVSGKNVRKHASVDINNSSDRPLPLKTRNEVSYSNAYNLRRKHYPCEVCKQSFSRQCALIAHKEKHNLEQEVNLLSGRDSAKAITSENTCCENGDVSSPHIVKFNVESKISTSTKSTLRESPDGVICLEVKKCSTSKSGIEEIRVSESKLNSNACNKPSTRKRVLDKHKRKRSLIKSKICDRCQKAFKDNYALNRHYVCHTGEKPYVCENCNASFTRKENLKRHSIFSCKNVDYANSSDFSERPYACITCKKAFKRNAHLKRHRLTHEKETSHVCAKCGRRFVRKYSLVRHGTSCNKSDTK